MWIVRDLEKTNKNLAVFYKKFTLSKKVEKALLKVSALGIFNVKINGQEIEEYFMPGWTNYKKYVYLCNYDVTSLLQENNLIEITISEGWYSGRLGYGKGPFVYGDINSLFAEITLCYSDGEKEIIETDESWRVGESKIVKSSFFDGETVDFTALENNDLCKLPFAKKYEVEIDFKDYSYEPVVKIGDIIP